MPISEELERLGSLFKLASERNRPFLDKCSQTKYLAVRDYDRATSITFDLAKQTLREANSCLTNRDDCKKYLAKLQNAIESGQLNQDFIHTLEKLKARYLERVLRPAIRTYLTNDDFKAAEIDELYNDALRIDGLLEVIQFLKKIEPVV